MASFHVYEKHAKALNALAPTFFSQQYKPISPARDMKEKQRATTAKDVKQFNTLVLSPPGPSAACRYGADCYRRECFYSHPPEWIPPSVRFAAQQGKHANAVKRKRPNKKSSLTATAEVAAVKLPESKRVFVRQEMAEEVKTRQQQQELVVAQAHALLVQCQKDLDELEMSRPIAPPKPTANDSRPTEQFVVYDRALEHERQMFGAFGGYGAFSGILTPPVSALGTVGTVW